MAVTHDNTTSWAVTTDAALRTWINAVHQAFIDAGLIQTADSGQINRATVVRGAVDAVLGYETFVFSDPQNATNVLTLKVSYGMGDTTSIARLGLEVGKGTNGSGTITTSAATISSLSSSNVDSANRVIHCSSADGQLAFFATPDSATLQAGICLFIDRELDGSGAYTGRVSMYGQTGNSAPLERVWNGSAWVDVGTTTSATSMIVAFPGFGNGPTGRVPVGTCWFGGFRSPCRTLCVMPGTQIATGEFGDISIDGVARTYICIGALTQVNGGNRSTLDPFLSGSGASEAMKVLALAD